ncbi:MAG: YicC family protein [Candidatus Wallbacteria bacterium]|nr:YicC family protein [Candidatus Wallbacteria bacterium]
MLRSMTGFAYEKFEYGGCAFSLELKSYNNKGKDLNTRLPESLARIEPEVREILGERIMRGKVYFNAREERISGSGFALNEEFLVLAAEQLAAVEKKIKRKLDPSFLVLRSEAFKSESSDRDEKLELEFKKHLQSVLDEYGKFRDREGKKHEKEIRKGLSIMEAKIGEIRKKAPEFKEKLRQKFEERCHTFSSADQGARERLYQELTLIMDRQDFNEEIVRFDAHLQFFLKSLAEDSPGKKLTFITQELLREINTLGVKCGDFQVSSLAVEIKDEVEKIKEQLLNIE